MKALRIPLVWGGAACFFAGALAVVAGGGRRAAWPRGSVFNETPEGISLAHRYLQPRVSVLTRRVGQERLPANAVLFRIRPRHRPRPERLLSPAEEDWVRGGGRIVLGVDASYGPLTVSPSPPRAPIRKAFPIWPGVQRLLPPSEATRGLGGAPADLAHAVFARGPLSVLSRIGLGRGDVLLLAVPEVLENAHLAKGDHLKMVAAMAGEGRPILFDEWAQGHGRSEGLLELMLDWSLGPALVGGALTFALWLWRGRARLGLEDEAPSQARSEAVDLVDSLAQLYDRALTRREAARLYRDGFQRAVGMSTGLKGAALVRRADELVGRGAQALPAAGEIPPSELLRALRAINDAYRRLHEHAHPRRPV